MPDELTHEGLTTKTNLELISELQENMQNIFSTDGEQLMFDSNSPDGQLVQILSEMGSIVREIATEIYNSFDPSKCSGAVQDSRYQLNYLNRKIGTFTRQNIDITVNQTVTLNGLDGSYSDVNASSYAISDDAGNIWYLIDTTTLLPGTTSCPFRAKEIGEVIPTIGTITNPVTIVQGVTKVINDVGYTILGTEEESDADFRMRRDRSTEKIGLNSIDAMFGQLLEIDGVTSVKIHSNQKSRIDETGTPAFNLWIIVGGGSNIDIANVIYANLTNNMTRGEISVPIITSSGQQFDVKFDRPTVKPLYIKFNIQKSIPLEGVNIDGIKQYVAANLSYTIGEEAETSKVTAIASEAAAMNGLSGYILNVKLSTGGSEITTISATGITAADTNIIAFQEKVNDIPGSYSFSYDGESWLLNDEEVDLEEYGIVYVGEPDEGDTIIVAYTASVWVDYIIPNNINEQFVTDATKIYVAEEGMQ